MIQQGHRVVHREAHTLVAGLTDAPTGGHAQRHLVHLTTVPLLIIDDLGMRKLPAAEDLLEIVMRRYERGSTLITSNRPVED